MARPAVSRPNQPIRKAARQGVLPGATFRKLGQARLSLEAYARGATAVLVLAAAAGLSGIPTLGGGMPFLYLSTASAFVYAGFRSGEAALARSLVGGFRILYLLVGAALAASFFALDFSFDGRGYVETVGYVVFGGVNIACARALPCEDGPLEDGSPARPRERPPAA